MLIGKDENINHMDYENNNNTLSEKHPTVNLRIQPLILYNKVSLAPSFLTYKLYGSQIHWTIYKH